MNEATIRKVKVKEKYAKKLNKRGIVIGAINDKDKIVAYKSDKRLIISKADPIDFIFSPEGNTYFSNELSSSDYMLAVSIMAKYATSEEAKR